MPYKDFIIEGIGRVIVYKRRGNRGLRISLTAKGVRVTIPRWAAYDAGRAFVVSKRQWILDHQQPPAASLTTGMAIGKSRQLTLVADVETPSVKTSVRSNEVVVWHNPRLPVNDPTVQQAAEQACWRALKTEANVLLTPRLDALAVQHGFSYRSLNFKRMTGRWGSCDRFGNIVLNIYLVQLPWELIDYVILHELTHTRALHHGPDFWTAFDRVLPGARTFRKRMRAFHPTLLDSKSEARQ